MSLLETATKLLPFGDTITAIPNMIMQAQENKRNRKFTEHMYRQQRADSLEFWNQQNEYNLPSAQMARLKSAGLNPNMIYGTGTNVTAGPIQRPTPQSYKGEAPQLAQGLGSAALAMRFDEKQNRLMDAAIMEKQNAAILKGVQATKTAADTALSKFSLSKAESMLDGQLDALRLSNQKLVADTSRTNVLTSISLTKEQRDAALGSQNLKAAILNVANLKWRNEQYNPAVLEKVRADINNVNVRTAISELERQLLQAGINKNDPMWLRVVGTLIGDAVKGKSLKQVIDELFSSASDGQTIGGKVARGLRDNVADFIKELVGSGRE